MIGYVTGKQLPNNRLQRTALGTAADAGRSASTTRHVGNQV